MLALAPACEQNGLHIHWSLQLDGANVHCADLGRATQVQGPVLEQRAASGGTWQAGPALSIQPDGSFSLSVAPTATTLYRLSAGTIKSAVLRVAVSGV